MRGKVRVVDSFRESAKQRRRRLWFLASGSTLIAFGLILLVIHFFLPEWDAILTQLIRTVQSDTAVWNLMAPSVIVGMILISLGLVVVIIVRLMPRSSVRSDETSLPVFMQSLPVPSAEVLITDAVVLYDVENQLINAVQARQLSILLQQQLVGKTVTLKAFYRINQLATRTTEMALAGIGFTLIAADDDAQGAVDRRIQEEMRQLAKEAPTHTILITGDQGYGKAVVALVFMRHKVSIWGRYLAESTIKKYRDLNAEVLDITKRLGSSGNTRKRAHRRQ